jgi:ABC-type branched-subunit amino acid transport system ATPase component
VMLQIRNLHVSYGAISAVRGIEAQAAADLADVEIRFPILTERRNAMAGLLSGGEQQILAIFSKTRSFQRHSLARAPSSPKGKMRPARTPDLIRAS